MSEMWPATVTFTTGIGSAAYAGHKGSRVRQPAIRECAIADGDTAECFFLYLRGGVGHTNRSANRMRYPATRYGGSASAGARKNWAGRRNCSSRSKGSASPGTAARASRSGRPVRAAGSMYPPLPRKTRSLGRDRFAQRPSPPLHSNRAGIHNPDSGS